MTHNAEIDAPCPRCGQPVKRTQPAWRDPKTGEKFHDPCPRGAVIPPGSDRDPTE